MMQRTPIELSPSEIPQYYKSRLPGLRMQGLNWRNPCLICGSSSGSLSIQSQTGLWKCFRCQRGGDPVQFERELTHVGFSDALRNVSEVIGRPLGNAQFTPEEKKRWAAEQRRIAAALPAAKLWRRAALEMADEILTLLKASLFDPTSEHVANINEIAELEQRIGRWRLLDGAQLVKAHREFSARDRKLAAAMVATARAHAEDDQVAAANYVAELGEKNFADVV